MSKRPGPDFPDSSHLNEGDSNHSGSRRKIRTTIVCNVCKYRKVRCDRNKPCSSCVKYNAIHLCEYNERPWSEKEASEKLATIRTNATPVAVGSIHYSSSHEAASTDQINLLLALKQRIADLEKLVTEKNERERKNGTVFSSTSKVIDLLSTFKSFETIVGVNPISGADDAINFYRDCTLVAFDPKSRECVNHGPFSWRAMVHKDFGLSEVWNFLNNRRTPFGSTSKNDGGVPRDEDAKNSNTPFSIIQRIREYSTNKFDPQNYLSKSSQLPLGLTHNDSNRDRDVNLKDRIQNIIPSNQIIKDHVDRFFKYVYPFYPYVDERDFRSKVSKILTNTQDPAGIPHLEIENKIDYAILGLLFLIIRLSYLSLISNSKEINERLVGSGTSAEADMLLKNPIGIEFVDTSRKCLNEFQLFHRTTLEVLQLALFIKLYMICAPEEPEGTFKNQFQIYNGVLIQMGYSLGLNRDPDKISGLSADAGMKDLRKKLWMHLTVIDTTQSMLYGNPYITSDRFVDTTSLHESERGQTVSMESYIVRSLKPSRQLLKYVNDLLKVLLDVKSDVPLAEITNRLSVLESYVQENYGTFKGVYEAFAETSFSDNFIKVLQIPIHFPVRIFFLNLYSQFINHYMTKGNHGLVFFYVKKVIAMIVEEYLPYCYLIIDKSHFYFGHSAQLSLNSSILLLLHRVNVYLHSFLIRTGHTIVVLGDSDPKTHKYKRLMRLLARCLKFSIIIISTLSHRLCSAWRIGNSHIFILKSIITDEFYQSSDVDPEERFANIFRFTDDQLDDLTEFMEKLFANFNISRLVEDWKIIRDTVDPAKSRFFEGIPSRPESKTESSRPEHLDDPPLENRQQAVEAVEDIGLPHVLNTAMEPFFDLQDPFFDLFNDSNFSHHFDFYSTE